MGKFQTYLIRIGQKSEYMWKRLGHENGPNMHNSSCVTLEIQIPISLCQLGLLKVDWALRFNLLWSLKTDLFGNKFGYRKVRKGENVNGGD